MKHMTKINYIMLSKEIAMNTVLKLMQKLFIFEKEPQKIGLSQLKEQAITQPKIHSLKNKDVKLSDLMRRAG